MSFIDASYFVAELDIPNNTSDAAVAERISWFIGKYEPEFLQKLFGYPLYKAFVSSINQPSPDQRFLDILYGKEYIDYRGNVQKWRGIIVTDSPVFNISGGLVYKKPQYLTVGTTIGLVAGATSFVFDGTSGTDNWIGWTPVISRNIIMKPGVDYSWDDETGTFQLLKPGDKFGVNEDFFASFELRTDGEPDQIDLSANRSCIANYVYFMYRRTGASQPTGIGEVIVNAENSINIYPRQKMITAWNMMRDWVKEFLHFMECTQLADPSAYPEWTLYNKIDAQRCFAFINPLF